MAVNFLTYIIMINKINTVKPLIGNTPVIRLESEGHVVHGKMESFQYTGSAKIRPAFNILQSAYAEGKLKENSTIVESTSGNFGIAMAHLCIHLGLDFVPIVDVNIASEKLAVLENLCRRVEKVTELDESGAYLLTRLRRLKKILTEEDNVYNPNQYENPNNYLGYYNMADELLKQIENLSCVIVSVSTGGCVTGLSQRLKKIRPEIKVVAVDIAGSMIFQSEAKSRCLSGLGAGKRGVFFDQAIIDEIVILEEKEIVKGAHQLMDKHGLMLGASSGAAYAASLKIIDKKTEGDILAIFPDDGKDYMNSIFNKEWLKMKNLM